MVKCMEDGHERIISHLQVVLTIESDVPGKNGDLASMDVVLNHDSVRRSSILPAHQIVCDSLKMKRIELNSRMCSLVSRLIRPCAKSTRLNTSRLKID